MVFRGRRVRRRCGSGVALLLAALALAPPPATAADDSSNRLVTFAARYCRAYTDIAANRARNNIQESLRDLGADTLYVGGEAVKPSKELLQQPNCIPLPNWRFTLGTGYRTRAVTGPWGALSKVTSPFATSIVTRDAIALLDVDGHDTGETLRGAVTVELTPQQARLAAQGSTLWLQGGLPDDPVLDRAFPSQYGFGALRCAIDNLNGDNVEFVAFPSGARHVFCYAYYVTPPPTAGTIVVRKEVDAPGTNALTPFHFSGNISYTVDHDFTLTAADGRPDAATFHRAATGAGDAPWSFSEDGLSGWQREAVRCVSETRQSAVAIAPGGEVQVRLAAGDVVTCTYVNRVAPPPAGLALSKVTQGGVGSFPFTLAGPQDARQTLTTRAEDVPVSGDPLALAAGAYRLDETLPSGPGGSWAVERVVCDGRTVGDALPLTVTLRSGEGRACLVANRFTPSGSIVLRKTTVGATGTAGFVVRPAGADPGGDTWVQRASTTAAGVPATARGEDTSALPLGSYEIVETDPPGSAGGSWALDAIVCNGQPVGSAQGRVVLTLTAAAPDADCTFVNRFAATPEPPLVVPPAQPPTPPTTPPEEQGRGGVAGVVEANGPIARLSISKRVSPVVARPGQLVRYTIVVVNRGPDPATEVSGVEVRQAPVDVLRVQISHGRCDARRRPVVCRVGRLGVGRRALVTVLTRAGRPGRFVNRVAVNAATADPDLRDNRAAAALRVVRPAPPRYTG
ncbi:DUF11 domain-containing protein [Conexibacter sp. JD483]|uniref:DUF11 domain-containing protein n=1 Tax=unclassified Conexibacter TaxID=2627773 RepID=UPI002728C51B|nr:MULTISPECIES: DUF11 domain-containing protein [unclassified Conexibacter]MDO8189299.1 DUF11 domain-containing protein [Conexibacter sp. CPCC 205706]MDO8201755.1 DUF11 domain-containing protein [Conexibacter sp. CPCC 205762]MDR9372355.1 DUF11 domain-containing protein [Conexibacter sp. JD483]